MPRNKFADIKNDFVQTTYLLVSKSLSKQEYLCNFLNPTIFKKPKRCRMYFVALWTCPRKPGALRELGERVTTYVAACTSPFLYWMDTMCNGSQSFVEPTMMIGPFDSAIHPMRETTDSIKQHLLHTRGVSERIVRLGLLARDYHVYTLSCITPVLTSVDLDKIYANITQTCHDGIFEKPSVASDSTRSSPPPSSTHAAHECIDHSATVPAETPA